MMENTTENNAIQENIAAETPVVSLGNLLREARENLGLSVADVASQIKFAPRQIEALEADDFKNLPETAFLRGFVRSYAKILHLDAQTLLTALPQKKAVSVELIPDSVDEPFPNIHSVLRSNLIWLGGALLLILIALGFSFLHLTAPTEQLKSVQTELPLSLPAETQINAVPLVPEVGTIEPVVPKVGQPSVLEPNAKASRLARQKQTTLSDTQPDTTTQPDASPQTSSLRLVFSAESWAEIKDRDGNILSSKMNSVDSELRVEGLAPFSILIGHAPSVELYYNGKQIDLAPHTRRSTDVAYLMLE